MTPATPDTQAQAALPRAQWAHRDGCGCSIRVVRCSHDDGQWVLAIIEEAIDARYVVTACPGYKLGRDRRHHSLEDADADFEARQDVFLGRSES